MGIIEFKGIYSSDAKTRSLFVLVQYDGAKLHVWHLAEPFYRLFSGDAFEFTKPDPDTSIQLPNGARIETEDRRALGQMARLHSRKPVRAPVPTPARLVLALIGSVFATAGLWWLASQGLFF